MNIWHDLGSIADEYRRLKALGAPLNEDGHIVSPKCCHPGSKLLRAWGEWLRAHPKSEWPDWLKTDVVLIKAGLRK